MINSNPIYWKDSIKYLGVYLDKRLTFKTHINKLSVKCENIFRTLYCFLNRKSKLNFKNKLLLYKALILPNITYASPVWSNGADCHKLTLQRIQNKFLKAILKVPPRYRTAQLHIDCNISTISCKLLLLKSTYNVKCSFSTHPVLRELCT